MNRPACLTAAGLFATATLLTQPARAEADLFAETIKAVGEAISQMEFNFHSQIQGGFFAVSADDFQPGGAGARVGLNVMGFGGSLGGRMERYAAGTGGLFFADFEFRPLPCFGKNLYRAIDPFVTAGLELGGGARDVRATQTFGAGLDLGLFGNPDKNRETFHPLLSIRYTFRAWQIPGDLPQHLLMIGAAGRFVF